MAIGVFKLSEKERQRLALIFNVLNILQVMLGITITGTSVYIYVSVSPVLFTERAEINFVFVVTGIYGTHVILHYLLGLKICHKCLNQPHKKSTSGLLLLWTCAGCNTLLNFIIISFMLRKISKHLTRSMNHSLQIGMRNYLKDLSWKRTIDKIQYELECCGIKSYEDWLELEWLNQYHYDIASSLVAKLKSDSLKKTLEVLPWSCCNVNFPSQCLHDPLQQEQSAHLWIDDPLLVTSSLNTKGCLKHLKSPIQAGVITFTVITVLILLIQVFIFLISRILYTSARNALLMEDPHGVAPGWIFGRGDCGYTGGQTIAEIMADGSDYAEGSSPESSTKKKGPYKLLRRKKKPSTEADTVTTYEESETVPKKQNKRREANTGPSGDEN